MRKALGDSEAARGAQGEADAKAVAALKVRPYLDPYLAPIWPLARPYLGPI